MSEQILEILADLCKKQEMAFNDLCVINARQISIGGEESNLAKASKLLSYYTHKIDDLEREHNITSV